MDSVNPLAAFKRELKKVQILGGTMSFVTTYKEYTEKALSSKRDIDTSVEFKNYVIIGMFGAGPDVASATFVSIPKGISVYPTDGGDIDSLVSISIERLSTLKIGPEIRWAWKTMKDFSPLEEQKSPEARFISKPFYQFYAFLAAHPQELGQFLSKAPGREQRLVEDHLPYGVSSCLKDFIPSEDKKPCNLIEEWGYQEKIQEKTTKGMETLRRFRNIEHLFTLPSISRQIIDIAKDPLLCASKMARIIEKDPVLTSKILKVVNSAFYGFHRKVDSIGHAIVILGNDEVTNLAFSIAVYRIMENISPKKAQMLWEHSLMVAHLSQWVGLSIGCEEKDLLYTIGLLHDLGKIAFFQRGEDIGSLDRASSLEDLALEEMETGLSHAEMGAYIIDRWNLPKGIVNGLITHHMPHRSTHMPISIALHLADLIAHRGEIDIDSVNSGAVRYMNEKGIELISNDIVTKVYDDIKVKVKIVLEN
ncbi:MAG: HDOD domain-containing protein [Thermodesulfobacteriota bacterium]|nr:HDOD domain-containing protein [Thermodesulfobacteriota bacterium]